MNKKGSRVVLVTGVAGSGKSTISRELNKRGFTAFNIEEIEGLFSTINKITRKEVDDRDNDDLKSIQKSDWVCDKDRLQALIKVNLGKLSFYCGTASNLDELLPFFDIIFLLIVSPKTIRTRLAARSPQQFGHTSEVQDWVLSWKEWWEEEMKEKGATVINADEGIEMVIHNIIEKLP